MTGPVPWAVVKTRLTAVLAAPEAERSAMLRALEPEVREAVEDLMGAHDTAGDFLGTSPLASGDAIREVASLLGSDPLLGAQIGPWRVRSRLGHGSMGTVYRAERDDGLFEREAALKVVHAALASGPAAEEARRRFDAERRLLAELDHRGIARLYDGGTLPDGRPWLAMEFVEGTPITAWADRQRPSIRSLLLLFADTLDALAHAHRHLVVHCDLKPAHLLVSTQEDARLRVSVLDFGVAAALGAGGIPGAFHTTAYAAPEQLTGAPVTTSSDVFSLGVVLFELLAGRRPARTASGEVTESVSAAAPPERRRALRGDLDAIVARALSGSPEARYPSAEAFRSDLLRHLAHRPVAARASSARYVVGRFVRRNRLAVASGVAMLLCLGALGTYHTRVVTAERDAAQQEAAKASATASFLTDLFRTYNPDAEIGDRVSARSLLDARVARILAQPAGPATPTLLDAAARAYAGLALYDDATPLAERALAMRTHAAEAERLASTLLLADLRLWTQKYTGADSLTAEALHLARRQGHPEAIAEALRMRARYVAVRHGHAQAEPLLQSALALQRQHLPRDSPELATTLHDYGSALVYSSQEAPAIEPLREALRIRRAHLGPSHPDLASTLAVLGIAVLDGTGDRAEAERLLTEADRIFDEALDRAHPEAATTLMNLGHLARDEERWADAEALYIRGMDLRRLLLGADHQTIAASLHNLALNRVRSGDLDGGYAYYAEARRILDLSFPDGHVRTTYQLVQMGQLRRQQGRFAESAVHLREAVQMRERVARHRPRLIARARLQLAATLVPLGRHQEAERLLRLASPLLDSPDDRDYRLLHRTYAEVYAETGRPGQAARHEALTD